MFRLAALIIASRAVLVMKTIQIKANKMFKSIMFCMFQFAKMF